MQYKLIRFAPYEVNLEQRELRKSGTRVPLQHKPFRILEMLLRQPGAFVSRQELAKELWPDLHVDFEHSLNSAVNTLRQALDDSPRASRFIETRSGLGYRFIAPVEEIYRPGRSSPSLVKSHVHSDYLRGRFFLNKRTSEGTQRAIGCFQSALAEDSSCALAHAGLADAYCQIALGGTVRAADVSTPAREAARAALAAQPALPEAQVSMGRVHMIFDWDWSKAAEHWSRAYALDPSLVDVHLVRALLAAACERHDEARREISQALELDPLSLPAGFEQAWLLYLSRHFHEAVAQSWRVLTLEPSFAPAQTILGLTYHQLGSLDEALTELENACICSDRHPAAVASLAHVYAAAGLVDKAQSVLAELATQAQRRHVSHYCFAVAYAGLDQRQLALEALGRSRQHREPQLLWLGVDPRLDKIRAEADFLTLRHDLNLA